MLPYHKCISHKCISYRVGKICDIHNNPVIDTKLEPNKACYFCCLPHKHDSEGHCLTLIIFTFFSVICCNNAIS